MTAYIVNIEGKVTRFPSDNAGVAAISFVRSSDGLADASEGTRATIFCERHAETSVQSNYIVRDGLVRREKQAPVTPTHAIVTIRGLNARGGGGVSQAPGGGPPRRFHRGGSRPRRAMKSVDKAAPETAPHTSSQAPSEAPPDGGRLCDRCENPFEGEGLICGVCREESTVNLLVSPLKAEAGVY